ncbi:MAG: hypothetical protein K2M05_02225 [Paramuribaculum sp.]|nr:hypothetical protein [Paramuribaculum sp.]MDE6303468.1 hypothetical protein [Paramuribaculum sp.]
MIDLLLYKYYNGETSKEEESQLAELLRNNSDPRYEADRRLICPLNPKLPDFGAMADKASKPRFQLSRRIMRYVASVAVVVAFGALVMVISNNSQPAVDNTMAHEMTVEEATEQAEMAFMLFSTAINRGYEQIENLQ